MADQQPEGWTLRKVARVSGMSVNAVIRLVAPERGFFDEGRKGPLDAVVARMLVAMGASRTPGTAWKEKEKLQEILARERNAVQVLRTGPITATSQLVITDDDAKLMSPGGSAFLAVFEEAAGSTVLVLPVAKWLAAAERGLTPEQAKSEDQAESTGKKVA